MAEYHQPDEQANMAESDEFPDVYQWISHLPPPSLWPRPSLQLPLSSPPGSLRLMAQKSLLRAKRYEDGCVSFFIGDYYKEGRVCLRRDIKWRNEEDCNHNNNNMHLITSLLSLAIASISHAIHHPSDLSYFHGMDLSKVVEDSLYDHFSIAQSSNYSLLFNSAFASMCILISPGLIRNPSVYKFILHPQWDIQEPLIQILGELFTTAAKWNGGWEPLNWSYAGNTCDSCEVKIYCPLLSMNTASNLACEFPNATSQALRNALAFQQVECIVQLRYDRTFKEKSIDVQLGIHNVRCDVRPYKGLLGEACIPNFADAHLISTERYFPSKISITIFPQQPCKKISVSQSSANTSYQIAAGQGWEVSYQAPKDVGVMASGTATSTTNINPWKFQQSAQGMNGTFKWILYDTNDFNGKEVVSSKPPKFMLYGAKSGWHRDRYRKACSPFTEEGGVVFASDNYGKSFTWTLNESRDGQSFKLKIEGTIWVTYWPNLHKTTFYESRYHEFSQLIEFPLANLQ